VIPGGLVSHANSLRPVFSTGLSIIHPIVRLDTRFMLAVRLISQRGGNLGPCRREAVAPSKTKLRHCLWVNDMTNVLMIDDYELAEACAIVTAFGSERFGYVVTPNVDHVIRHYHDPEFRALYAQAAYVFLDSHFLAHLFGFLKRQRHRVSPGSDLTAAVMSSVIKPNDVAVMVGGSAEQAQELRARFGLKALRHIDPPMNFIRDNVAVESCLRAIEESSPFRFCFLAIGSPQQEIIAQKLKERGVARGLALCIGASINFITGVERRAPLWIRKSGFEWLFRLVQNPRRLAKRYLVHGPRIFLLLPHIELRLRRPIAVPCEVPTMSGTPPMTAVTGSQV
jgi:exopolysaccharide biosynthesis WecB/TagA/CpsF family protein